MDDHNDNSINMTGDNGGEAQDGNPLDSAKTETDPKPKTPVKTRIFQPADPNNPTPIYPNWLDKVRTLELQWIQEIDKLFQQPSPSIRLRKPLNFTPKRQKPISHHLKSISPPSRTNTGHAKYNILSDKSVPATEKVEYLFRRYAPDIPDSNSSRFTIPINAKRKASQSPSPGRKPMIARHPQSPNESASSSFHQQKLDADVEEIRSETNPGEPIETEQMYAVLIAKPTTKKHRTWQNDGTLIIKPGNDIILLDEDKRTLYSAFNFKFPPSGIVPGETELSLGDKLVQIQHLI